MPATALSDPASFRVAVLAWYGQHGRSLNFRRRQDAYAVLVAEAMAQQTQISRVEPAWEAFLGRFPSVQALAGASTADVLRAWAGMGYNRRALNLQRAARVVVDQYRGTFPESVEELERLPGIGPYTARAVAAIAFGAPVGAVDTNVRRVLGRAAGGWGGLPPTDLQALADDVVPPGRAGEWTHALMDIGARFCRPRSPICGECPAQQWCAAAAASEVAAARDPADGAGAAPGARRTGAGARTSLRTSKAVSFRQTARWLRGRLVDRARAVEGEGWVRYEGPIGSHDAPTVAAALLALASEGLLELDASDATLARLPR